MPNKNITQTNSIEPTSYLWRRLFAENQLPINGVVVEVAPGYEPKIGNALALFGFHGTIFLIEPDQKTACHIQNIYQQILPHAIVKIVIKSLQRVEIGVDIPCGADALVASHPFDDMVIASMVDQIRLFSEEKEGGENMSPTIKKLYDALKDKDYARGIRTTVATWKHFISKSKPNYFIASQYPSHTLIIKGLTKRQNSGFAVLKQLKNFYKKSLVQQRQEYSFGYKGDPEWWIIVKKSYKDLDFSLKCKPLAIKRLGKSIFVTQQARRLDPKEYDIVYVDNAYFRNLGYTPSKYIRDFAIVLNNEGPFASKKITTYADRQKDKTDISLSGNHGSGRAVYYGDRFNILGVGKTTLCKSTIPSHSTGNLELIGAIRRLVLSKWINYFTQRAPAHPVLIALKKTVHRKWSKNPIPLALLVRVDDGTLDRPSHIEQSPHLSVNFQKTLTEYAKLDAEYFAYRIILGAWSTNNYSLDGHAIDLESASFVKYRGPYYTSTSKYPHNRFGYEGLGFLRILHQLADIKNIKDEKIENSFYKERCQHLGRCFLSLLGVNDALASTFFFKHQNFVEGLANQFENLSKKVSSRKTNLNLYASIPNDEDPSLLDMPNLFKNLANLYKSSDAETIAFKYLIRKTALSQIETGATSTSTSQAESFIGDQVMITHNHMDNFMKETKSFIHALFQLLASLDLEKCLGTKRGWDYRLRTINQSLPTMFELNTTLKSLAESYRTGSISPEILGSRINKLCELPKNLTNEVAPKSFMRYNCSTIKRDYS